MGTSIIKPCDPHLEEPETVSYMEQHMIRNAILQTCKQARREGKGMLLDKNAIFLCGQFDLNTFIQAYQHRFGWNRNMYKYASTFSSPSIFPTSVRVQGIRMTCFATRSWFDYPCEGAKRSQKCLEKNYVGP